MGHHQMKGQLEELDMVVEDQGRGNREEPGRIYPPGAEVSVSYFPLELVY